MGQRVDALSDDERRMMARQQEVFAGFLTHTDAQIGRLLAALDEVAIWTTPSCCSSRTTVRAPRAASRAARTSTASPPVFPNRWPTTSPSTTTGRLPHYNHYSWGWHGGQHAQPALEALHLARRDEDAPRRALASGHRCRSGVRSQLVHVNDCGPRWPTPSGSSSPPSSTA